MISLLLFFARFFFVLALWTAIGQIPIKGSNLENHYHRAVNSQPFQKAFWTIMTPITWTGEKVKGLWDERKSQLHAR